MVVKTLELQNFKCYQNLLWDNISPRINLLVGENGAGKTAILEALTAVAGGFFRDIPVVNTYNPKPEWTRIDQLAGMIRRYPTTIAANLELDGQDISVSRTKNSAKAKYSTKGLNDLAAVAKAAYDSATDEALPIIGYYSTKRLHVPKSLKTVNHAGRFAFYNSALDEESDTKNLLQWYKERYQMMLARQQHDKAYQDPYISHLNNFLVTILSDAEFGIGDIVQIYYDLRDEINELVIVKRDGSALPISYFSDGFRNILLLVFDLGTKAIMLNNNVPDFKVSEVRGVVLIDEIDLNLHPSWQAKITGLLAKFFCKVQFFLTTHSPIVINHLSPKHGKVYRVSQDDVMTIDGVYATRLQYVLSDLMRFEMEVPKEVQSLVDQYRKARFADRADEASAIRSELVRIAGRANDLLEKIDLLAAIPK